MGSQRQGPGQQQRPGRRQVQGQQQGQWEVGDKDRVNNEDLVNDQVEVKDNLECKVDVVDNLKRNGDLKWEREGKREVKGIKWSRVAQQQPREPPRMSTR